MFATHPAQESGWYVIQGTLEDGTRVDLLKGEGAPSFDEPELISATFPRERWRKYLINLWPHPKNPDSNTGALRRHYAQYLHRQWNETHSGDKALKRVEIYFVWRRVLPDYQHLDTAWFKDLLWPLEGID